MTYARAPFLLKLGAATVIAVVASAGVLSPVADPAHAGRSRYSFRRVEKCMMKKINNRRARHGKRKLRWDRQLGYVARHHARKMARNNAIFHDSNLASEITRWRRLGQNVGVGGTCRRLFKAFWQSSGHRHNIMGQYRYVGVGSKRSGRYLFVHQVFEYRRDPGNIYSYP